MFRGFICVAFLSIAVSCSFSQTKEVVCNPTVDEQAKRFYLKPAGDSLLLVKSGTINGKDWISFLSSNKLLSDNKIIDCATGTEIKTKYWTYDISYRNKRLIVNSHKDFWAFHEGKKDWVGPLGIPTYTEEIYADKETIGKTSPVIALHLPYYGKEALTKLNEEFEKYVRDHVPASNYLLLNRLLVAALNGDSVARTRLLTYRQLFPNSNMDKSVDENIQLLQDYEVWLANGGKRIFLTSDEFPILK